MHTQYFFLAVVKESSGRLIEEGEPSHQVKFNISFFHVFYDGAVLLFTLTQSRFGPPAFGDVPNDSLDQDVITDLDAVETDFSIKGSSIVPHMPPFKKLKFPGQRARYFLKGLLFGIASVRLERWR